MASDNSTPGSTSWQQLHQHPREAILTWCQEAAPNPWYPSVFSQNSGIPRDQMDPFLDELRLGGLIQLTDWVQGRGQGYALTPAGLEVVQNPRLLDRLRAAGVQRKPTLEPIPQPRTRFGAETWERGEGVRQALLAPFAPRVTKALILVNVLVFVAGGVIAVRFYQIPLNQYVAHSDVAREKLLQVLEETGAVSGNLFLNGDWWRLLTSCFVHIGLLHLAFNMYALYVLGAATERMFGPWRYLILYLIAGFGGSCLAVLVQPLNTLTAGASGAICGLLGAQWAWVLLNRGYLPPQLVSALMKSLLINTVLIIIISSVPGVSWGGHLGGSVLGLIAAAFLNANRFRTGWVKWLALVGTLLLPVVSYEILDRLSEGPLGNAKQVREEKERENEKAQQERQAVNEVLLPHFAQAFQEALVDRVETQARELAKQKPGDRDRDTVRETLAALDKARAHLQETIRVLRLEGPYQTPGLEDFRRALIKGIEDYSKLVALYQRCLEQEDRWTNQESQALAVEQEKVDQFRDYMKRMLKVKE